jgi:uncharacterized protein (DUF111 family)
MEAISFTIKLETLQQSGTRKIRLRLLRQSQHHLHHHLHLRTSRKILAENINL